MPAGDPRVAIDVGLQLGGDGQRYIESDRARSTGAGWVRVNFVLGPHASVEDAAWRADYDAIVDSYLAEGLAVYALIGGEAVDTAEPLGSEGYIDAYAYAFVSVVDHFKDRIRVFESYNEPNNWIADDTPALAPDRFAEILERLYLETKVFNGHASDPAWQVTLVSGALFSFDLTDASEYLDEVYSAGRFAGAWDFVCSQTGSFPLDGIGYHIYVREHAGASEQEVHDALRANFETVMAVSDAHETACPTAAWKQAWLSEVGWNAELTGEDVQARNVPVLFDAFHAEPRVGLFTWFTLVDFPEGPYGLLRLDGSERPSWDAFRLATGAP